MTDPEFFHQINSTTSLFAFTLFAPYVLKCHHDWSVMLSITILFLSSLVTSSLSSTPPPVSNFLMITNLILILQAVTMTHVSWVTKEDYDQQQSTLQSLAQLQSEGHIITKKYEEIKYLLGNVTHDLKSPLQAFRLELDSLRQGFDLEDTMSSAIAIASEEPLTQSINLLQSLCDFMLIMINRTLDYTKTVSGMKLISSHQTADLHEMMIWVKQLCLRSLHPIPIAIEPLPDDICSHIITDPQWFKENLLCLVSNAQKFSPDGVINIRCVFSPDDSEMIRVEVEDGGIGIPEEKMEQLFQPFQQAQLMAGGTGLGLFSLSKRIECLGGSCGVKKREDGQSGSCFWFTMRYRPDDEASMLASNHSQEEKEKEVEPTTRDLSELKLNILVVEDSLLIQKTTTRSLKKAGHTVEIANNGLDCLKLLNLSSLSSSSSSSPNQSQSIAYDVILMDLHMPIMDGLEATRRIRELENSSDDKDLRRQLIVGLSANSDSDTSEKAVSVGMNDFLAKPLKIAELNSCLQRLTGIPATE
jgi:signal transduction histidine kinase/CheY-like chemotaxis protein